MASRTWRVGPIGRWALALLGLAIAKPTAAQSSGAVKDVQPIPRWAAPGALSLIGNVRELRDGRVLVVDAGNRMVYLIRPVTGTTSPVGRHGSGPGEYLLPSLLLPLAAGETGILDPPNARILVLSPNGIPSRVIPERAPRPQGGRASLEPARVSASDTLGRLYARAQPAALAAGGRIEVTDTAAIERWTPGAQRRDTAGFIPVFRPPDAVVVQGLIVARSGVPEAFPASALWTAGAEGRLAIVYSNPYRVVLLLPGGRRVEGPIIQYSPIRLTEAEKRVWREASTLPSFQTVYPGNGSPPIIRKVVGRPQEPKWPEFLPAITGAQLLFDELGRLWVARSGEAHAPQLFDVFGRTGVRVGQVRLPASTRLLGFGPSGLYVARRDRDDLESLQLHEMPELPMP